LIDNHLSSLKPNNHSRSSSQDWYYFRECFTFCATQIAGLLYYYKIKYKKLRRPLNIHL